MGLLASLRLARRFWEGTRFGDAFGGESAWFAKRLNGGQLPPHLSDRPLGTQCIELPTPPRARHGESRMRRSSRTGGVLQESSEFAGL